MQNELAIVIPFYKKIFFEKTLTSLINQSDKRFNLYILDDSSPDSIDELLTKYKNRLDFNYFRLEKNIGNQSLAAVWNQAISNLSKENWLMILGDDDVLSSDVVMKFYSNLNTINILKINVVRFASKVIDEYDIQKYSTFFHPKIENSKDFLFRLMRGKTRSSLSEYAFRLSGPNKLSFSHFPVGWWSDLEAVIRHTAFNLIFTINTTCVYFRLSSFNITASKDNLSLKNRATFQFFSGLLIHNGHKFTEIQRLKLLLFLKKAHLNNKRNIYNWWVVLVLFFNHGLILSYFKIFKRL